MMDGHIKSTKLIWTTAWEKIQYEWEWAMCSVGSGSSSYFILWSLLIQQRQSGVMNEWFAGIWGGILGLETEARTHLFATHWCLMTSWRPDSEQGRESKWFYQPSWLIWVNWLCITCALFMDCRAACESLAKEMPLASGLTSSRCCSGAIQHGDLNRSTAVWVLERAANKTFLLRMNCAGGGGYTWLSHKGECPKLQGC